MNTSGHAVEAGKSRLVETVPGEPVLAGGPGNGTLCVFESSAGEQFSVVQTVISEEQEAHLMERLREILGEERICGEDESAHSLQG
jgi:hypothetical protein